MPDSLPSLIEKLDLRGNRISGTLPPALWLRHDLSAHTFMFDANPISGTLPTELGALHVHTHHDGRRRRLHEGHDDDDDDPTEGLTGFYLGFQETSLSGTLPTQIGALHGLEAISLMEDKLSGTLPGSLFSGPWKGSLSMLNFADNAFPGTVPTQMGARSARQASKRDLKRGCSTAGRVAIVHLRTTHVL